jgi:hypothetical protein
MKIYTTFTIFSGDKFMYSNIYFNLNDFIYNEIVF